MKLFAITCVLSLLCFTLAGFLPPFGLLVAVAIVVCYIFWLMGRDTEQRAEDERF